MGVDISGWVEVCEPPLSNQQGAPRWEGVINISEIAGRNYALFGFLFDVRNNHNVQAPFAHRGIPTDLSAQTWASLLEEFEDESIEYAKAQATKASWLTWREIQSLNWDGAMQEDEMRIPVDWEKIGADTNFEYTNWEDHPKYRWFEIVLRRRRNDPAAFWETYYRVKDQGFHPELGARLYLGPPGGGALVSLPPQAGVFELRRPTWRDQQHNGWDRLFKQMAALAEAHGEDGVRLVAWFDQL